MGAAAKDDGAVDKKAGGGEKKKDVSGPEVAAGGPSVTVEFQFNMHCAGCAKKVKRAAAGFPGVEEVTVNNVTGMLKVSGQIDPGKIRDLVESKMHKKVNLVRFVHNGPVPTQPPPHAAPVEAKKPPPQQPTPPPADGTRDIKPPATGGGGGGGEEKAAKHSGDEKPKAEAKHDADEKPKAAAKQDADEKPKAAKQDADEKPQLKAPAAPVASEVVIRMSLHCDDCIVRLKKRILKMKGVESVEVDALKNLVKVKGTMDAAALPTFLEEKTRRRVEVVSSPAKKNGDGDTKKGGDGDGTGEKKKKDSGDAGSEKPVVKQQQQPPPATATANKMQYRGLTGEVAYAQLAPQAFAYSAGGGMDQYASPYSSYSSYASPPPPQQQYAYPYPGPDQAGPSSYGQVAYPPYGSNSSGYYPGASPMPAPGMGGGGGGYYPAANGYFEQAPQMFSDENPNGCSVM